MSSKCVPHTGSSAKIHFVSPPLDFQVARQGFLQSTSLPSLFVCPLICSALRMHPFISPWQSSHIFSLGLRSHHHLSLELFFIIFSDLNLTFPVKTTSTWSILVKIFFLTELKGPDSIFSLLHFCSSGWLYITFGTYYVLSWIFYYLFMCFLLL